MKKRDISAGWDERRFSNQNWKRVLKEIVDYAPNRYGRGKRGYEEDHPLAKRLKMTAYELTMITAFLEEQELIEYDEQEHNWIHITSKGFDVALQNENQKLTFLTNYAIILFTAIITFMTVVDVMQRGVSWFDWIAIVVFLGIIMFYAWRTARRIK